MHPPPPRTHNRFWYFFFSGALAFYLPYVPLFMRRDLGWQPVHVGCAFAAPFIC
jgi:hypothetical protein